MNPRTRRAHIRATAADSQDWKLTWCPATGELYGRPLHARNTYTISGSVLIEAMSERGNQAGATHKDDPRQMKLIP